MTAIISHSTIFCTRFFLESRVSGRCWSLSHLSLGGTKKPFTLTDGFRVPSLPHQQVSAVILQLLPTEELGENPQARGEPAVSTQKGPRLGFEPVTSLL